MNGIGSIKVSTTDPEDTMSIYVDPCYGNATVRIRYLGEEMNITVDEAIVLAKTILSVANEHLRKEADARTVA